MNLKLNFFIYNYLILNTNFKVLLFNIIIFEFLMVEENFGIKLNKINYIKII